MISSIIHNPAQPPLSARSLPEQWETLLTSCEVEDQTLLVTRAETAKAGRGFPEQGSALTFEPIKMFSLSLSPPRGSVMSPLILRDS